MSDQPDTVDRTFWFKCSRGHVEERTMPREGDPPMLCAAYLDQCGAELRHIGPTVAEWRATNDELRQARLDHDARVRRLESMLAGNDAALADCAAQIDDLRVQLESAEAEVEHLREGFGEAQTTRARKAEAEVRRLRDEVENATQAAALNRDAAMREAATRLARDEAMRDQEAMRANAAAATRERDHARRAKSDASNRLATLRRYLVIESDRQDDRGRHGLANRMREARSASWNLEELASQGVCLPVPEHFDLDEYREAGIKLGQNWSDALAGVRVCSDWAQPIIDDEVILITGPPPRVERFLGCKLEDWQSIIAEVRSFYSHLSTPTEMLSWLLRDARDAKAEVARLEQRGMGGFTLVRDVNQQTERERDEARAERDEAHEATRYWQDVALWAASATLYVSPQPDRVSSLRKLGEAYSSAFDAESAAEDWGPSEPMVYEPNLLRGLQQAVDEYGLLGVRNALDAFQTWGRP